MPSRWPISNEPVAQSSPAQPASVRQTRTANRMAAVCVAPPARGSGPWTYGIFLPPRCKPALKALLQELQHQHLVAPQRPAALVPRAADRGRLGDRLAHEI